MIWIVLAQLALANPGAGATADPHGAASPHGASPHGAAAAPAAPESTPAVVKETMNSGGYTYVLVDIDGTDTWVAGPEVSVNVGDPVLMAGASEMRNFESRSLGRVFDRILFVGTLEATGAKKPAAPAEPLSTAVATLEGGHTVAALYAGKADLNGTAIGVRGVVMKVSPDIQGKTFLHIQDGSGQAADGTHDLTVTTPETTAAVGDTVVVRGTLAADQDLGAGYRYAVLLDGATVTVEPKE